MTKQSFTIEDKIWYTGLTADCLKCISKMRLCWIKNKQIMPCNIHRVLLALTPAEDVWNYIQSVFNFTFSIWRICSHVIPKRQTYSILKSRDSYWNWKSQKEAVIGTTGMFGNQCTSTLYLFDFPTILIWASLKSLM